MIRRAKGFLITVTITVLFLVLSLCSAYLIAGDWRTNSPVTGTAGSITTDLYWISFGGSLDGDPLFVMQIDQSGIVTKAPKKVLLATKFGSDNGATALGKNGLSNLNLWVLGGHKILYRTLLSKSSLNLIGLTKTSVAAVDNDGLQATQKSSANFLALEVTGNVLKAFAVGSGGLPTGTSWLLAPNTPNLNDESTVSADGRVAVTNRNNPNVTTPPPDQMYIQLLASNGRPSGSPKLLAKAADIEAADVTSALTGGERFVVYVVKSNSNKLFLQRVDSLGSKIGSAILLNTPPGRGQDDQVVAIDPLGRFVVFTIGGGNFGCSGHDVLVYQALSTTGQKVGAIKPLAKCGLVADDIINVDILKE